MHKSKKSERDRELTVESLSSLRGSITRRLISSDERVFIVENTRRLLRGAIYPVAEFVLSTPPWRRKASVERSKHLFGLDRPDSSLMTPRLNWKMSLSERMATESLAKLLNAGGGHARASRIEACLRSLGLGDDELGFASGCLASAEVFSEVPARDGRRIDLKFLWRDARDRERVLVVEAKFGHVVTDGQLRCYRDSTRLEHPAAVRHHLILALAENALLPVIRRYDGDWRFCSWRDMWLRFETARPIEHDLSLQLFLNALWRRIGQLNPKDAHAPL
ncbi:MAG: hypothetical protein DI616_08780 [Paracoccus denitrificans]|uniref:PD-(D/E)XK nuclease family protein n=1 Tax=Paracoccus denitrificans TaxID=266 RepID=A0A533IAQ5_PARDE|nr:MAG: hypothetical protein DI616_08780 [Paracoccus denitrificans]